MTADIGDEFVVMPQEPNQLARAGEIREIREGPGGVIYLVHWSDTGDDSLVRPGPDAVIKHPHRPQTDLNTQAGDAALSPPRPAWRPRPHPLGEHPIRDLALARRVHDILVGCGLTHTTFSVGGGRDIDVPEVVTVDLGPPLGVIIRILPGQTPDDYTAHTPAIAYNLGMARVHVIPVGPHLIRLNLIS